MTNDIKYANSLAEVLYYLQGIKKEYIKKIPISFMKYLVENATKHYECTFDYKKPLSEINLSDDAKAIIGLIAVNYWCESNEQRKELITILNENVAKEEIKEEIKKYNFNKANQNSTNPYNVNQSCSSNWDKININGDNEKYNEQDILENEKQENNNRSNKRIEEHRNNYDKKNEEEYGEHNNEIKESYKEKEEREFGRHIKHKQKYSIQQIPKRGKHELEKHVAKKEKRYKDYDKKLNNNIESLALRPYKEPFVTRIINRLRKIFKK